jgi:hypothetical protein
MQVRQVYRLARRHWRTTSFVIPAPYNENTQIVLDDRRTVIECGSALILQKNGLSG